MLKKLSLLASAVLVLVVGLRADNIVDEIIARVNNQIITRSDMEKAKQTNLDELKQRFPSDWQAKWNKAQNDILRDLIDQQLLLAREDFRVEIPGHRQLAAGGAQVGRGDGFGHPRIGG